MSDSTWDIAGKLCLVTGATSGIGRAVAANLVRNQAHVVIASRDEGKCERVVDSLIRESGNLKVEYAVVDLSDQLDIERFAGSIKSRFNRLDVLINNAGEFFFTRRENPSGLEMTFALNHLGYFSTTLLLLDLLVSSAPARIINVASTAHRGARIHFDDLQLEHRYRGFEAYGQSKLANLLFTYELARRLDPALVSVNALHPGFIATQLISDNGLIGRLISPLLWFVAASAKKGAETPVYLATSPEAGSVTGKYFVDREQVPSSPQSYDEQAALRLWQMSLDLTGLQDPLGLAYTPPAAG